MINKQLEIHDGYLHHVTDEGSCPVLCPFGQGAGILCCTSCAAFGSEGRLEDGCRQITSIYCAAMPLGGVMLGRLANG